MLLISFQKPIQPSSEDNPGAGTPEFMSKFRNAWIYVAVSSSTTFFLLLLANCLGLVPQRCLNSGFLLSTTRLDSIMITPNTESKVQISHAVCREKQPSAEKQPWMKCTGKFNAPSWQVSSQLDIYFIGFLSVETFYWSGLITQMQGCGIEPY